MSQKIANNIEEPKLTDKALSNLDMLEEEIETSSNYFKPRPDRIYMISMNPEEKIEPRLNDRFKTQDGKPVIRYECKITHVNNGKAAIMGNLQDCSCPNNRRTQERIQGPAGSKVREDRGTVYKITGIQ